MAGNRRSLSFHVFRPCDEYHRFLDARSWRIGYGDQMNTVAACFLIPLGVAIYVVVGGMRSTLLCDYTAIILTFVFTVYETSGYIGSVSKMHYLLSEATRVTPVSGNAHGSYLTLRSTKGLIFGVINLIGDFATVFQDPAYWQRAIASRRPATTVEGIFDWRLGLADSPAALSHLWLKIGR